MHCNPRQLAGNIMRNLAAHLTILAEHIDPQPTVEYRAFTIYGDGTYTTDTATLGNVRWHRTG